MFKKSIGSKIFCMLVILQFIFCGVVLTNINVFWKTKHTNEEITGKYIQLQRLHGEVSTNFQQVQLYANLSFYKEGTQESEIVKGKLELTIENLRENITQMEDICNQLNEPVLKEAMTDWKDQSIRFSDYAQDIYETAMDGNYAKVEVLNGGIKASKTPVDEAETVYEQSFSEALDHVAESSAKSISNAYRKNWILIAFFTVVFAIILVIVRRMIINPAKKSEKVLNEMIDKIGNNEGDLTLRIPVNTSDEIGQMAKGINHFVEVLQQLMKNLKSQSEIIKISAGKMSEEVNESNLNASNISSTMEQMSASMEEIAATVSQIATNSEHMMDEIVSMNKRVDDGVGMIGQIKERAQVLHRSTNEGKAATSKTIQEIRQMLSEALDESKNVEKIQELTGEILSITSQTNLLSLNASIEAARAGEAGRGFAVVADEIRSLADSSAETANNIQNISNLVTGAVDMLAENAERMLKFVDEKVLKDYDDFVKVVETYENDADDMGSLLDAFSQNSSEIKDTIITLNANLNDIATAVDENAKGVTMAAESSVSLVVALEEIKTETSNNKGVSDELNQEVNRFSKV